MDNGENEYSPEEEERFRKDLELALQLSLQEQSVMEYSTEVEWSLRGDMNGNAMDVDGNVVSRPVALPKDHPVVSEIRADAEGAGVSELGELLTRASIHDGAAQERMVLERLSQASSWAQHVAVARVRGAERMVPDIDDLDTIPNLDEIPCRDVDDIPRLPVGEGALKKVPARRQRSGDVSDEAPRLPQRSPARRPTTLPPPATTARLLADPEAEAAPPQENVDAGWRTPPSDTEDFLRDLEIARQMSLMENWAPVNKNEAQPQTAVIPVGEVTNGMETELPKITSYLPDMPIIPVMRKQAPPRSTMVDTNGRASKSGSDVATSEPPEEIYGWLSSAQRHDPQLVKIAKAIKNYLARTGKKEPNQPCKYCPDKCECVYVTTGYLEQFGMEEVVRNASGVELLSGSDLEFTSSGEHKLDSSPAVVKVASKATDQLRQRHVAPAAQGSVEVQRNGSEVATPQDNADPDPAASVERWYKTVLGQSSGSDGMDQDSPDTPTDNPMRMDSIESERKSSAKSQKTNGWTSRTKYGNEKLVNWSTQPWNSAKSVWSPVAEDTLKLRPTSKYPFNTLPTVNYYPPGEESSTPSNEMSDDTTTDAVEIDSQSVQNWCPDMENDD